MPDAPKPKWYHSPWFVLLMISPFFLGPFGLLLLWKNPRFSQRAKIWLSIISTSLFFWFITWFLTTIMKAIQPSLDALRQLQSLTQ